MEEDEIFETSIPVEETDEEMKQKILEDFMKILGVGATAAEKIYNGQYYSLMDIAAASLGDFMEKTGMTKQASEKVIAGARAVVDIGGAVLAKEMLENEDPFRLSTGSKGVNELIGGGFPIGLVTEIFGENGSGKSQCCFTASVITTQPTKDGGLDGHVIYIDTEGTFRAHRIKEIAEARGLDWEDVLSKIHVLRPLTSSHQILMMDEARKIAAQYPVRLIVCDSLIGHFRSAYIGRGTLAERQQLIGKHLADIKSFAIANDAVAIITSQVSATPDSFFFGPNYNAIGGHVVHHATAYRLMIRKGKAGARIMRLVKAPDLPDGEAVCVISNKGVEDKGKA